MTLTKGSLLIFGFLFSMFFATAQSQENTKVASRESHLHPQEKEEAHSILQAFKQGVTSGHLRYFFMATNNITPFTDYYANAMGAKLKFETAPYRHFQVGLGASSIFNLGSSDFTKPDSFSKQNNRYEIALFDLENPSNKFNIHQVEELYVKYSFKNLQLTFGRQGINTPFINLQDGRMRPTRVEGLYGNYQKGKGIKLEIAYLYRISPRSTRSYYSIGRSIGIYPTGFQEDGSKSNYKNNLQSKGILLAGITSPVGKNTKLQIWNQFVENIFNTTMVQADIGIYTRKKNQFNLGIQSIFQTAMREGGNENVQATYFSPKNYAFSYGAKASYQRKNAEASLNYNRITAFGRFLMPREWGREPFFTFLPRERNEGLGDVHAWVLKFNYVFPSVRLKTNIGLGYYDLPSVKKYKWNKYGLPSYAQLNLDIRYEFKDFLKGLEAQLLWVHKINAAREHLENANIIHKVDMTQINAVLKFRF